MFFEDLSEVPRIAETGSEGDFRKREDPFLQQDPSPLQTSEEQTAVKGNSTVKTEGPSQSPWTYVKMAGHTFESEFALQLVVHEAECFTELHFAPVVKTHRSRKEIFHADHEDHAQLHGDALTLQGGIEAAVHPVSRQMEQMELGGDVSSDRCWEEPDEIWRRGEEKFRPLPEKAQME